MPTTRGMARSVCGPPSVHHTPFVIAGLDPASRACPTCGLILRNSGKPEFRCNPSRCERVLTKKIDPRVKPAGDVIGARTEKVHRINQCYRPRGRQPPRMPARPEV